MAAGTATLASTRIINEIAPWLVLLVVLVLIGGFVLMALRKRLRENSDTSGDGFTLHDLRELHIRGELSDEEFERARAAIIDRVRGSATAASRNPASGNEADAE